MMGEETEGARSDRAARRAFRAPILAAAAVICLITGLNLARLVPDRAPRNPWEASEVMEGWRSLRGMPVYELGPDGHATHFYGALAPWVQGEIFRWVGPNNISGRVLTLIAALGAVTLIAACTRTKGSGWLLIVVWAALLGFNHRSVQYFSENRPDMSALFFAAAAIVLMGLGLERRRPSRVALGTACLIIGFFFKQTVVVFAAVPPVALALRGRRPTRAEIVTALAPSAAMIGVVLALRAFWPAVYHYMIQVPGSYQIAWGVAANGIRVFVVDSPMFLVLIGEWLVTDGGSTRKDARMPWILAVLAIAIPSGTMAAAKFGGGINCMLPAMLGMMAFCALRMTGALAWLERGGASTRTRFALGSFAAALLLLTVFPRSHLLFKEAPWEPAYDRAVAAVSRLPGTVVCPEDPTIPMLAKGYAGRGLFPEMDAHPEDGAWPREMPEGLVNELRSADYVVDAVNYWQDHMDLRVLERLGFVPADAALADPAHYRLWRRERPDPASAAPRTAWSAAADSHRDREPDR